ncbi:hypothetical protein KCP71_08795 [Salmonella enterica subsp. enterica]|nr:hypothetical protein KCP71_08795 [Salmonella enterica subsp. enterica]
MSIVVGGSVLSPDLPLPERLPMCAWGANIAGYAGFALIYQLSPASERGVWIWRRQVPLP